MSGIPSGNGSEVLSSTYIHAQSNTETAFRWDGTPASTGTSSGTGYTVPTNFIISVLSINFTDMGGAEKLLRLWVDDASSIIFLLYDQTIPAHGSFVLNDRLVLKAGHKLVFDLSTTGNVDAYLNYIVQDWT